MSTENHKQAINEAEADPKSISDKPVVNEVFADNGEHSHWELIDSGTGKVIWSECPEELNENNFLNTLLGIIIRYRKQTGETGVGNHIENEIKEYLAVLEAGQKK